MRALVVYESMFGNTAAVAEAIGEGIGSVPGADAVVIEIGHAPHLVEDVDLLVAGGPTHAFGLSREKTRADAAARPGAEFASSVGLREWIAELTIGLPRPATATFDTRMRVVVPMGSAARAAGRLLKRLQREHIGAWLGKESFLVTGAGGPLREGEIDRARRWGRTLAERSTGQPATAGS